LPNIEAALFNLTGVTINRNSRILEKAKAIYPVYVIIYAHPLSVVGIKIFVRGSCLEQT
jgi:hypothetical protein